MKKQTKLDCYWGQIFEEYSIIEKVQKNEFALIEASEINKYREARLMTKFDHKSQLPQLFLDNKLSILPVSRKSYIIGGFKTFEEFDQSETNVYNVQFPNFLESIDPENITSEAIAINCAFVSKIFNDFLDEGYLYPTVNGRMSSSSFSFDIECGEGLFPVKVNNSQIEIDGGYEGENFLALIEAKNYISDDFLIRQLYYPYKLWSEKVHKKVRPIFLTYSNGVFHLREYAFVDDNNYNSIKLIQQKKYSIKETSFNIESLKDLIDKLDVVNEPCVSFPQADNFERVINLCELVSQNGSLSMSDITLRYDFVYRQANYYAGAAIYLGLLKRIEGQRNRVQLTVEGQRIFKTRLEVRQIEFVKLIISHRVFRDTLNLYLERGEAPSKNEIVEIMKSAKLYNMSEDATTYPRRASTVLSWVNWVLECIEHD
ncbi:type II restriction enzyme [Ornithobacterium rhinotracheale]